MSVSVGFGAPVTPAARYLPAGEWKETCPSELPVAWYGHEPLLLIIPEVNVADGLLYRVIAEQDEDPDYIMRWQGRS